MAGILLIDSDDGFVQTLAGVLSSHGHTVAFSGDCKDGFKKATDFHPSAIVLCVELPRTSGFSLLNKLKKDDALKHIPVVMISGEETRDSFEERKRLPVHADDYLLKPFTPEALEALLQPLLARPPPPPPPAPVVVAATPKPAPKAPPPAPPRAPDPVRLTPPPLPPPLPRSVPPRPPVAAE